MLTIVRVIYVKIVEHALTELTPIAAVVLLTLQETIARLMLMNVLLGKINVHCVTSRFKIQNTFPDLRCVKMEQHAPILTEDTRVSV